MLLPLPKKAGRIASNGVICVTASADGLSAAAIEMNSETDFVAKNDMFKAAVAKIGVLAAEGADTNEKILASPFSSESPTVQDEVTRLVATIGENMNFRRVTRLSVGNGIVSSYVHSAISPGMGKTGCLVAVESPSTDTEKLNALGKMVAMHIAASTPRFLNIESVDPAVIEKEKSVLIDQAKESGKPEAAIEKMVEGRVRKFYEEICLLEQPFIMEPKKKVKDIVAATAKELDTTIDITAFTCMVLGDGLEVRDWTE